MKQYHIFYPIDRNWVFSQTLPPILHWWVMDDKEKAEACTRGSLAEGLKLSCPIRVQGMRNIHRDYYETGNGTTSEMKSTLKSWSHTRSHISRSSYSYGEFSIHQTSLISLNWFPNTWQERKESWADVSVKGPQSNKECNNSQESTLQLPGFLQPSDR